MIKEKFYGNVLMGTCLWEHAYEHACGKMLIRKCLWESRIQKNACEKLSRQTANKNGFEKGF